MTKLHELRQYVLHTDDVPKYLALTGSDAFKCRTDASPLLGFFLVETGGQLNRVIHLWEYDSLDHRTAVRKELAGNKDFITYFSQIRPWLASQTSVLLKPTASFDYGNAAGKSNGAFFALRQSPSGASASPAGSVALVGSWTETVGTNGQAWQLFSSSTYQQLLDSPAISSDGSRGDATTLMAPTGFSPMQ